MLTALPLSRAVVTKSENLNFLEPSGPLQACNGTALPLPLLIYSKTEVRVRTTSEIKDNIQCYLFPNIRFFCERLESCIKISNSNTYPEKFLQI